MRKAATNYARSLRKLSIRVKRAPKPVPVKAPTPDNPPLLLEPAVLLVYIFVTTHAVTQHTNAAAVAAYHRHPTTPLFLLFLDRCAAPLRPVFLASPLCRQFQFDLASFQRVAQVTPSDVPDADEDVDDDVQHQLMAPNYDPLRTVHRSMLTTTSL